MSFDDRHYDVRITRLIFERKIFLLRCKINPVRPFVRPKRDFNIDQRQDIFDDIHFHTPALWHVMQHVHNLFLQAARLR